MTLAVDFSNIHNLSVSIAYALLVWLMVNAALASKVACILTVIGRCTVHVTSAPSLFICEGVGPAHCTRATE